LVPLLSCTPCFVSSNIKPTRAADDQPNRPPNQPRSYPNIFVSGGLHDPRVGYWEPAKLVARLRASKTDQNLLLLKTEMGAGHFSVTGRFDRLKDRAQEYAFLLKTAGQMEAAPLASTKKTAPGAAPAKAA
jgi:oligopeptidase B